MKKNLLYLIDTLDGIGGAEVMMVAPMEELREFFHITVVTLRPGNAFEKEYFTGDVQYCLDMYGLKDMPGAVRKLKAILKTRDIHLVHSFLYWSSVVARVACGNRTPCIFNLATLVGSHVYRHKWYSRYTRWIDALTYHKSHVVVAPTLEVLKDFDRCLGVKGPSRVIFNFVRDPFFAHQINWKRQSPALRLVAVGNIKPVKNYQAMIEAMEQVRDLPISLDIYGSGSLTCSQEKKIRDLNLPVSVKGQAENIYEILPRYDAFVMASFQEGFGISAAEAMATGLPLIVSDIEVFREVTLGNALFFNPRDPGSLAAVLTSLQQGSIDPAPFSQKGKLISLQRYTRQKYIQELMDLYKGIILN
ncbi:MAG: glycosyltransferase [Bacteroidota bacterium]|nr:glycosyltransferase [Bacteroidota bacterium]